MTATGARPSHYCRFCRWRDLSKTIIGGHAYYECGKCFALWRVVETEHHEERLRVVTVERDCVPQGAARVERMA